MANAYVTDVVDGVVHIISVQTNRVIGQLSVPSPNGLALSPTTDKLYEHRDRKIVFLYSILGHAGSLPEFQLVNRLRELWSRRMGTVPG